MSSTTDVNPAPEVIPSLQRWTGRAGTMSLADGFRVVYATESLGGTAAGLVRDLAEVTGIQGRSVLAGGESRPGDIVLALDPEQDLGTEHPTAGPEGYALTVGQTVAITARTLTGLFWGTRTVLQMAAKSTSLPQGIAIDWPNYAVRGFMLDVGRRFAEAGFIRDYIRFMSWFKMNTFLVHLSDNEITKDTKRSWPEAQHGFRLATDNPAFAGLASTDGSYDRADWDSFEEVAAAHHVTLVPEIDVPAHSRSIISWKPSLGLNDGDSDMLNLSNPDTLGVVKDIFSEFTPWFKGPSVHFGADEYARGYSDLYRQFFNDMSAHLRSLGKDPIAWGSLKVMSDDVENPADGYSRDVVLCAWSHGWYDPQDAVDDGYTIINTNDGLLYIVPFADYYHGSGLDGQSLFETWEPHVFSGERTLAPQHPQLLGAASALWNDLVLSDYNEHDVHGLLEPTFGTLAQKMWVGAVPELGYEAFTKQLDALRNWPGREFLA